MKPYVSLITLGVTDLDVAVRFYREGLGLPTDGIVGKEFEHGAVAFFDLQPSLRLALWPRASIAHETGLTPASPGPGQFTLSHNVASRAEVDAVMRQAADAACHSRESGWFDDPGSHNPLGVGRFSGGDPG